MMLIMLMMMRRRMTILNVIMTGCCSVQPGHQDTFKSLSRLIKVRMAKKTVSLVLLISLKAQFMQVMMPESHDNHEDYNDDCHENNEHLL